MRYCFTCQRRTMFLSLHITFHILDALRKEAAAMAKDKTESKETTPVKRVDTRKQSQTGKNAEDERNAAAVRSNPNIHGKNVR